MDVKDFMRDLQKHMAEEDMQAADWKSFLGILLAVENGRLAQGTELTFMAENHNLDVSVDGVPMGSVPKAPHLCAMLFSLYLGPDASTTPGLKPSAQQGFIKWAQGFH